MLKMPVFCVARGYKGIAGKEKSDKDANDEPAALKGKNESMTQKDNLLLLRARPELVFHAGSSHCIQVFFFLYSVQLQHFEDSGAF